MAPHHGRRGACRPPCRVVSLRKTVPFTYSDYADHYRKSTYDKDGYVPGTEGERYGDTLYVAGEKAVI